MVWIKNLYPNGNDNGTYNKTEVLLKHGTIFIKRLDNLERWCGVKIVFKIFVNNYSKHGESCEKIN